jgi:SAM-dependent methyltransferase
VCLIQEPTPRHAARGYVQLSDRSVVARACLSDSHHQSTMLLWAGDRKAIPLEARCTQYDASAMGYPWDPTLYRGSARYYREGRLPYAPGMADELARSLGLDGLGRLMDVGCGPGIVGLDLAALVEEVVGIDADQDMVAEAISEAQRRGVRNSRWISMHAEDLPADLGQFRVATFAQSFHWMDRERVADIIRTMLEPDGALVHINGFTRTGVETEASLQHPQPPWAAIAQLVHSYLGSETRAGQGLHDAAVTGEDEILLTRFVGPQVVKVTDGRALVRTADQVVAAVYSVSSSAPHLFGEGLSAFESDLRTLLRAASPEGLFSQQTGDTTCRIWRPHRQVAPI